MYCITGSHRLTGERVQHLHVRTEDGAESFADVLGARNLDVEYTEVGCLSIVVAEDGRPLPSGRLMTFPNGIIVQDTCPECGQTTAVHPNGLFFDHFPPESLCEGSGTQAAP